MQSMKFASRKRFRSDSTYVRPQKTTRVSRKSFYRLAKSFPDTKGHLTALIAAALIPGTPSVYHQPSDEETGFVLPLHNSQNVSSTIGSSPPRTPPPKHSGLRRTGRHIEDANWSGLLPSLVNSPTPALVAGGNHYQTFTPSISPSQHVVLPSTTPILGADILARLGTPCQQFNFTDFVNLTPSPTQTPCDTRTPGNPLRLPTTTKETRK
jgi:hypothetical protein